MRVTILVRTYDENFNHPFMDPVRETEVLDAYVDAEDAQKAKARAQKKYPRDEIHTITRELKGGVKTG